MNPLLSDLPLRLWLLGLCLLHGAISKEALGQSERLELGRRLQRFEQGWESAEPVARAAAVAPMTAAVRSFFAFNLSAAGRQLDEAWRAVRPSGSIGELEQRVTHLQLSVTPQCADTLVGELRIQLTPFYARGATDLADGGDTETTLYLSLLDARDMVVATHEVELSAAERGDMWPTGQLAEGDYRLLAEARSGEETFLLLPCRLSRISDFDQRLELMERSLADAFGKMEDSVYATVRETTNLLRSMQGGTVQEIDYPAARRLQLCEALIKAEQQGKPGLVSTTIAEAARDSDVWLALAKGRKNVPVRLRAPAHAEGATPVIFLFHGAGGSENMFFETYGAGRVVEESLQRGWLVVAPRQALFGLALDIDEMLDAIDDWFEIDRSRILLLGHSMGAGQVIRQASIHPQLMLAAVALGGGRRVTEPESLSRIEWFVAAGEQDFGRGGAQQLHRSLTDAQVSSTYRDYPDVEHMVIVQAAIDDVFAFLDRLTVKWLE